MQISNDGLNTPVSASGLVNAGVQSSIGNIGTQNTGTSGNSSKGLTPAVQAAQNPGYTPRMPAGLDQEALLGQLKNKFDDKTLKQLGAIECATCASRQYQDGSNDPGVSFKAPTHIDPAQSGAAVMAHEQEHVTREQANAKEKGGEVISQSVSISMAICPECGRSYTSGGVTRTTISYPSQQNTDTNAFKGQLMDMRV